MLIDNQKLQIAEAGRFHVNWAGEMNAGWDEPAQAAIRGIGFAGKDWRYLQPLIELSVNLEFEVKELSWDDNLLYEIANNPKMPERILQQLVEATDDWVRRVVASNTKTPRNILEQLVNTRDRKIRLDFSLSSETPVSILEQLASDSDPEIRRKFAAKANLGAA